MAKKLSKKKFLVTMLILCAIHQNLYAGNPTQMDTTTGKIENEAGNNNRYLYLTGKETNDGKTNYTVDEDVSINITDNENGVANITIDTSDLKENGNKPYTFNIAEGKTLTLENKAVNMTSKNGQIGGGIRTNEVLNIKGKGASLIIRDESKGTGDKKFSDGGIQLTTGIMGPEFNVGQMGSLNKIDVSSTGHGLNIQNDYIDMNATNILSTNILLNADNIILKGGFIGNEKINDKADGISFLGIGQTEMVPNKFNLGNDTTKNIYIEGANSGISTKNYKGDFFLTGEDIYIKGEKNGIYGEKFSGMHNITGKKIHIEGETGVYIERNSASTLPSVFNIKGDFVNIISENQGVVSKGGNQFNIEGDVNIKTDNQKGKNIALYAEDELSMNPMPTIDIQLKREQDSFITGDIAAINFGKIKIENSYLVNNNYEGKLTIIGDLLAGKENDPTIPPMPSFQEEMIHINLGKEGYLEGRTDNYKRVDLRNGITFNEHEMLKDVTEKGSVFLNMGENSEWNVTGQSWVDYLYGTGKIILNGKETGGYAVHIDKLDGKKNFEVNLNPDDIKNSDMIYINDFGNEKHTLKVKNQRDLLKLSEERIRFATVADTKGEKIFGDTYTVKEEGINNVNLSVQYVDMDKEKEADEKYKDVGTDEEYNGSEFGIQKPGNDYVQEEYNKIDEGKISQNIYLSKEMTAMIINPGQKLNDNALTITEMAKANYSSAVYMDNLNKRLGDMSFAEGNSGLWVRMRNDRIGEDKEYRLHNNMAQIGYDKIYNLENGKEHRGIAFDYADGQMKYKNLKGESDIDRYTVSLYDTRVYNSGVYADYTARAGYMTSDFEVYGRETGNQVKGDYDNLVLGVGAEFGKRYNFGETSYFEPQIQLQYTYIDDTDYTTNQDTKVNYDEIHSLIGRAGIRVGHDFYKENSKDNTVYLKFDMNHEFLGDQDVKASDVTGTLNKTYNNDNTWYDIGIGGAKNLTENLYVYADMERQFGEERDNSWQFNLGFRYKFGSLKDFAFNTANLFDFDKSEVKPAGKEMIKNASEIINKKNIKGTLLIEGHTDWTGSEEYNQLLSEKRARAVQEAFEENVTNENIKYETKGYGETKPKADNRTSEGRAENRRVEINYVK